MSEHYENIGRKGESPFVRAAEITGRNGLLRISRSTFYALVATNKLPRPVKIGRIALWCRDELLEAFARLVR